MNNLHKKQATVAHHNDHHGTVASYTLGFVLSIVFTILPYLIVVEKILSGFALVATLIGFALLQLLVQLVFFLHIGAERGPRWNLMAFASTAFVIAIVVIGSLWVMYNLDYNMMPAHEVDEHLLEEEGIRP